METCGPARRRGELCTPPVQDSIWPIIAAHPGGGHPPFPGGQYLGFNGGDICFVGVIKDTHSTSKTVVVARESGNPTDELGEERAMAARHARERESAWCQQPHPTALGRINRRSLVEGGASASNSVNRSDPPEGKR